MWTRLDLKNNAKNHLRSKYWTAFAVSLVVSMLAGGRPGFTFPFDEQSMDRFSNGSFEWQSIFLSTWFQLILIAIAIVSIIGLLYAIFIAPVIQVGGYRWYSRSREAAGVPSLGQIFSLFRNGDWLPTVGGMLWMNLWLFLWSLLPTLLIMASAVLTFIFSMESVQIWITQGLQLDEQLTAQLAGMGTILLASLLSLLGAALMIPVIIKQYAYRLTPWILADNPRIGYRRALKLSIEMTRGQKFEIFVLDLSFIGWWIAGFLACCIGVIFVVPYYMATQAELYAVLRANAVQQQLATMEDFGYTRVLPADAPQPPMNHNQPPDQSDRVIIPPADTPSRPMGQPMIASNISQSTRYPEVHR